MTLHGKFRCAPASHSDDGALPPPAALLSCALRTPKQHLTTTTTTLCCIQVSAAVREGLVVVVDIHFGNHTEASLLQEVELQYRATLQELHPKGPPAIHPLVVRMR